MILIVLDCIKFKLFVVLLCPYEIPPSACLYCTMLMCIFGDFLFFGFVLFYILTPDDDSEYKWIYRKHKKGFGVDAIFTSDDIVPLGLMLQECFYDRFCFGEGFHLVERAEDCRMNQ